MKEDPVPKYERAMTENSEAASAAQRARRRALIVPREHGAWGLLLVPLFTGVAAACVHDGHAVFILVADTTRKPHRYGLTDGPYIRRTLDSAHCVCLSGRCIRRLSDRADVERSKLRVVVSRSGNRISICGPGSSSEVRSQGANGGATGGHSWPDLHCSGCLLHRHGTAR